MTSSSTKPKALPAFFPLFLTTNVPAKTFNALLEHPDPQHISYQNIWVLVQSPATDDFVHGLSLADEDKMLETGFQNASIKDLADYCVNKFTDLYPYDDDKRISDYVFAVMDERSVRDHTLRIVGWDEELQKDENSEIIDDDLFVERWATARATFKDASTWAVILKCKGLIQFKMAEDCGDDGVLAEDPLR